MSGSVVLHASLALAALAFFGMGLSVVVRLAGRPVSPLGRRFRGLAAFGLVSGLYLGLFMVHAFRPGEIDGWLVPAFGLMAALSLFWFALAGRRGAQRALPAAVALAVALWVAVAWMTADSSRLEAVTRIAFGLPASMAAGWAFLSDRSLRRPGQPRHRSATAAGVLMLAYGVLGLVPALAALPPAAAVPLPGAGALLASHAAHAAVAAALAVCCLLLVIRLDTALAASEAGLEKAQRIGNMGSWEWNVVTNDLSWSDQIYRIFGLRPQEFEAGYPAFLARVHPDDRRMVEDAVARALERREPYDLAHRIVLPDGTVRHVHEQGEIERSRSGEPLRMTGTAQDITAQVETERALRENRAMLAGILSIAEEAIVLADNDLRITLFSRGAQRVFGYDEDEAIGLSVNALIPPRFHGVHGGHVRAFSGGQETSIRMGARAEVIGLRKNGEEFPAAVSLSKFPAATGFIYSVILRDVGPEKAARDELLAAKLAAESANEAKSSFLANMSHELRTPLNAVIGFSETIAGEMYGAIENRKYIDYAADIGQAGRHLLSIINDILDLSKIEVGQVDLHEEPVDVARTARACLNLVRERAARGGVNLREAVPDDAPALIADARMLKQLLINLLSNAIKFTPEGGTVTLALEVGSRAGCIIRVADTGIGIAPEDIPKAMTPFRQVDSKLNRRYEGTGLGLPLAKSFAEMHGGALEIESEPGVGTTAVVRLPASRIVADALTA